MYNAQTILMLLQMCMLPLEVHIFPEQGGQSPIKIDDSNDPTLKIPQSSASRKFLMLAEIIQSHSLLH